MWPLSSSWRLAAVQRQKMELYEDGDAAAVTNDIAESQEPTELPVPDTKTTMSC
jgi:hypothetical protein